MKFALRPYAATDQDWLVQQHTTHYAQAEGFDDTFGPLVKDILDVFWTTHDPATQAGWIAHRDGVPLGSIFCVRLDDRTAKLRLFYVIDAARSTSVAQALLDQCLAFARQAGYVQMTLWTHQSHRAAGGIYRRNGFTKVAAKPVHSFGIDLVEETWEIAL